MKKILLTIITIITVLGISGVSSAKDSDETARKRRHAEMLREAKAKSKAAEKKVNVDKSESGKAAGKGGAKAETAKKTAVKGKVDAKETITARGKEHQQQIMALDKQMVREKAKFLRSTARLKRIRELAVEKGDTRIVERVDKLIAKAQQINSDKHKRILERKKKVMQLSEAAPGRDIPKIPDRGSDKVKAMADKAAETRQPKTGVKPEDAKVKEKPVRPEMKRNSPKDKPKAPK